MTGKDLFREIGVIKEEYIVEAQEYRRSIIHNVVFRRSIAAAACLVLCFGLYIGVREANKNYDTALDNAAEECSPDTNMELAMDDAVTAQEEAEVVTQPETADDAAVMRDELDNASTIDKEFEESGKIIAENITGATSQLQDGQESAEVENQQGDSYARKLEVVEDRLQEYSDDLSVLRESEAYVILHGNVQSGQDKWDAFAASVEEKMPASIDIIQFTVEGDPIITYVHFNGENFYVIKDNSRDAFAGMDKGLTEYTFETLQVTETETEDGAVIVEASLSSGEEWYSLCQFYTVQ